MPSRLFLFAATQIPAMKTNPKPESKTRITFDLRDILTSAELEQFKTAAEEAKAPNLTEHFLDLTLRVKPSHAA